jgi:hypothetical protein
MLATTIEPRWRATINTGNHTGHRNSTLSIGRNFRFKAVFGCAPKKECIMQHTPNVPIPKEEQGPDWYPLLGVLALILIAVLIAVAIANPVSVGEVPAAVEFSANPELAIFEKYQLDHAAAFETARWHENPELSTFHAFQSGQTSKVAENPEVGLFWRWLEGR